MFRGAAAFLAVAMGAAILGESGIAALLINIAWIFFLFGLAFAAHFSFLERKPGRTESPAELRRAR